MCDSYIRYAKGASADQKGQKKAGEYYPWRFHFSLIEYHSRPKRLEIRQFASILVSVFSRESRTAQTLNSLPAPANGALQGLKIKPSRLPSPWKEVFHFNAFFKNFNPFTAISSRVGSIRLQMAAARAMTFTSVVNDSMTTSPL